MGSFPSGVVYGYPAIDMQVNLVGAVYHNTNSTPLAFEAAAALGFDSACRKASPVLLEPIMLVDVMVPKDFLGEVIGNLTSRKGEIISLESKAVTEHIRTRVPLANMFGYSTSLRNITQGRATFAMEFSHFAAKSGELVN